MGNFSKDPQTAVQEALTKGYSQVLFQQGKPVLDRELNLLGDLASPQRLAEHHIGNGVPAGSNGFRLSGLNVAASDFTIEAGRCLVAGQEVVLAANTTYKTQPHPEHVAPFPGGTSNVYLRVFRSEVTGAQDTDLNNTGAGDVGFETAVREKVEWEVLVTALTITTPDHFLLATINTTTNTVRDFRRNLTVAAIQDEIALARGNTNQLNDRLNVSLAADGTLKPNVVGNAQLADGAITQPKVAPGTISLKEMKATVAAEGTTGTIAANGSVIIPIPPIPIFPAALPAGFYTLNVSIVNQPALNTTFRVSWQEEFVVSRFNLGNLPITTVGRQWRITNLTAVPVNVAFKIYRIDET